MNMPSLLIHQMRQPDEYALVGNKKDETNINLLLIRK